MIGVEQQQQQQQQPPQQNTTLTVDGSSSPSSLQRVMSSGNNGISTSRSGSFSGGNSIFKNGVTTSTSNGLIVITATGLNGNEEDLMNLTQLLACFPFPPTHIPVIIGHGGGNSRDKRMTVMIQPQIMISNMSTSSLTSTSSSNSSNSSSSNNISSSSLHVPNNNNNNNNSTNSLSSVNLSNYANTLNHNNPTTTSTAQSNTSLGGLLLTEPSIGSMGSNNSFANISEASSIQISNNNQINQNQISFKDISVASSPNNNINISKSTSSPSPYKTKEQQLQHQFEKEKDFESISSDNESESSDASSSGRARPITINLSESYQSVSRSNSNGNYSSSNGSTQVTPVLIPKVLIQSNPEVSLNYNGNASLGRNIRVQALDLSGDGEDRSQLSNSINNNNNNNLKNSNNIQPPVSPKFNPEWEVNLNYCDNTTVMSKSELTDQLVKICKGDIPLNSPDHSSLLNSWLCNDNHIIMNCLDKCYEQISLQNATAQAPSSPSSPGGNSISRKSMLVSSLKNVVTGGEKPAIRLSKSLISFGSNSITSHHPSMGVGNHPIDRPVPLNIELVSTLTISSTSNKKAKFKIHLGPNSKSHSLTIEPKEGVLKKKESVSVTVRLTVKHSISMRRVAVVEVEGGLPSRHYLVLHAETRTTPFGLPLQKLQMTSDGDDGVFKTVPNVLVALKKSLIDNGGLVTEGIFRLPPTDERLTMMLRERDFSNPLAPITPAPCPHNVASLIKSFFREMRQPMLADINLESFQRYTADDEDTLDVLNSSTQVRVMAIISQLKEPVQSIFLWLIDLLASVSNNESINKMTAKVLAVTITPNLYSSPLHLQPTESVILSNKIVNFIHHSILLKKNNIL